MKLHLSRQSIEKQKKIYLFFISIILISIIFGFFFYFIISDSNKELVINTQKDFFINLNNIKYLSSFLNSIFSNFIYIFLIFILGLSVVGILFIFGILIFKSFILGFSISSLIGTFGFKGIILSFLYLFPHQVFFLIVLLLMSYYGCSFSIKLFKHIFRRSIINFRMLKDKYIKILLICLGSSLICSIYEVFLMPHLLKIFM